MVLGYSLAVVALVPQIVDFVASELDKSAKIDKQARQVRVGSTRSPLSWPLSLFAALFLALSSVWKFQCIGGIGVEPSPL